MKRKRGFSRVTRRALALLGKLIRYRFTVPKETLIELFGRISM
ncbi:hypothetical protein [Pseudovibrio exalbescens]|nr:hypothetical protein [Pseudovibrio exalbescens]